MKSVMEQICEDCPYYEPDIDSQVDTDEIGPGPCQNEHICKRVAEIADAK